MKQKNIDLLRNLEQAFDEALGVHDFKEIVALSNEAGRILLDVGEKFKSIPAVKEFMNPTQRHPVVN